MTRESLRIATASGDVALTVIGTGSPLLLLHGFPQSRAMWEPVVEALSTGRQLVIPDLPGYGESAPPAGPESATKRATATKMIEVMKTLGHDRFDIAGHDRGGRVAYRMALDHPKVVQRLAVLDILPTSEYWAKMDRAFALKIYHWPFLAQPHPFPETLIGAAPDFFIDEKLMSWTACKTLAPFAAEALEGYRLNARDPLRLKAMCDDYRAGASFDVEHDEADRRAGRKIEPSTLIIWGGAGIAQSAATPLDTWTSWCDDLRGVAVPSGHFPCEECPEETAAALNSFFD